MRIWIDLANSPHPVLFEPIADALEARGHETVVSARDHAQTVALVRERWPEAVVVGGGSPSAPTGKAFSVMERALRLAAFGRGMAPDVAVSHNSYAQAVAARIAGIPCVTAMDYEHQPANHVAFRCAQRVLVPQDFPTAALRRQGARPAKVWRYRGFKEEAYLHGFNPDPSVPERLGLENGEPFVVARPSPSGATYHPFGNPLFEQAVLEVLEHDLAKVILLARSPEDLARYPEGIRRRLVIPDRAIETRSLLAYATALIGAGGTMNREAALLGTPVFSLYAGALGALDRRLIHEGRMVLLSEEIDSLPQRLAELRARGATNGRPVLGPTVLQRFVEAIETPVLRGALRA